MVDELNVIIMIAMKIIVIIVIIVFIVITSHPNLAGNTFFALDLTVLAIIMNEIKVILKCSFVCRMEK